MPPTDSPDILATGSPDELKAWLYDASVTDVKADLDAQEPDARPHLAAALASLERERGDDARSTLLAHLDQLAPDAPEAPQDAPESAQEDAKPSPDAQDPAPPSDGHGPADGHQEEASGEPAPSEVVVDHDCTINYGGQLLRLTAGEQLRGGLARYCATTGAPVSTPADPAEEDE